MKKRGICLLLAAALLCFSAPAALAEGEERESSQIPVIRFTDYGTVSEYRYTDVTVTVYDTDGSVILLDDNAQWRLHGNSTLSVMKKPFKFKLSQALDLFGMGESRKWILLANAFDKTLLRNKLALDLATDIGLAYTPESVFVDVYNGDRFLGNYLLVESIEVEKNRLDMKMAKNEFAFELFSGQRTPDGEYIKTPRYNICLELTDSIYLPDDQREYLLDFFDQAEAAIQSGDEEEIGEYLDIQSFLDAYIVHEYTKNPDTAFASTRFYLKDGKLYAGPMWDFDLSLGNDAENCDWRHRYNGTTPNESTGWYACNLWWKDLVQTQWFRELFRQRYLELQPQIVNLYQDNELGQNRVDALIGAMDESIESNYEVWTVGTRYWYLERRPEDTYEENVEYLRNWMRERNEWILAQEGNITVPED